MFVDGAPDGFGFALGAGIESAHDALEFGEFLDHLGGEIGFAEQGGAVDGGEVGAETGGEGAAAFANALGFLEVRADAGVEGDVFKVVDALGEGFLLVDFPEEAGVVEAGFEDAFIALADEALAVGLHVHDGDEVGGHGAVGALEGEVALVVAHDGGQDFSREAEELFVEGAEDGGGEFGEEGEVVQEGLVGGEPEVCTFEELFDAVEDLFAAFGDAEDDAVLAEAVFVVGVVEDDFIGAEAAVAAGVGAGLNAGEFEFDDLIAEQAGDPADGPDEAGAVLAGPVHGFRPGDFRDQRGEGGGEDVAGFAAGDGAAEGVVFALGGGFDGELVEGDAVFAGETGGGAFAGGFRRAHDKFVAVGLADGEGGGAEDEAAGGAVELEVRCFEAVFIEDGAEEAFEVGEGRGDHPVGDLFDADFEEEGAEVAHAATPARRICCWSTQAVATPTASLRTRAMTPTRSVTLMAPRASRRLKLWEHLST